VGGKELDTKGEIRTVGPKENAIGSDRTRKGTGGIAGIVGDPISAKRIATYPTLKKTKEKDRERKLWGEREESGLLARLKKGKNSWESEFKCDGFPLWRHGEDVGTKRKREEKETASSLGGALGA